MSPQTMLVKNTSKINGGTAHNTITSSTSAVTTSAALTTSAAATSLESSASLCVRTNNLPASLTITPTSSSANAGHGNKAKQIHHTSTLAPTNSKNNNTATLRCSNLPTLQWPWSTTTSATPPSSSSSLPTLGTNISTTANTSSATSLVAVTSLPAVAGNSTTGTSTTLSTMAPAQGKKRTIAPYIVADMPTATTAAKKSRTTNSTAQDSTHLNTLANHTNIGAKRLKAAALEESQTKITGYFKSQMKAQIQAAHSKSSSVVSSGTSSCSNSNSSITTNALTMSAPATTASLNKYFNILAQLKENNKQTNNNGNTPSNQANKANTTNNNNNLSSIANVSSIPSSSSMSTSTVNTLANSQLNVSTVAATTTAPTYVAANTKLMNNLSIQPVPMPALKKIERPKPTKIAQVAPNLRKTPSNSHNSYNHHSSSSTGKSPAKKHVAIAPRTPEMKQQMQQHQQQLLASKQDISKQQLALLSGASATQSATNLTQANSAPQPAPAVLLTAIRLPTAQPQAQQPQGQTVPSKSPLVSNNKLTQNANSNPAVASAAANTVPTPPAATLYQLPTVQLPNLVQLPQLLAANGANIMHLNNLAAAATMAKNAQASAQQNTNNNTSAGNASHSTQQAAQAAAAQYFLNGTVFKLQQFTTATTTTATSAAMGAPTNTGNPFNLLSAADLQDMLIKQQQQQQQLQQLQQQQQKANLNNLTAASASSFQEIFQQQIAAAIAANQQQQQQQAQLQHLQRLGAAANIQQQPVFMATPAGLLLNAASLPAMLAQAAAALAINNHQQQQHQQQQQQQQQQKAISLPALQPIQSAPLPALSSIFAPQQQHTGDQQHQQELHHQQLQQLALAQQQFINSTQPPPLATVALTTTAQQQQQQQQSQQLTHNNNNSNSSSITTISNALQNANQQQLNTPIMGAVAPVNVSATTTTNATNNTAKLAIVKANNNVLPTNYPTLSSQPPPLVTISNRTHKTISSSNNTISNTSSKANQNTSKPYQKRSSGSKQQNLSGKSVNKSPGGKITTASGKIIATPTTPPPLVPTMATASQQPVALTSVPAKGIRSANLTKTNTIMPTPALVSISSTNTTSVQPKATQSLVGNSVTISPVVPTPKSSQLVNIAPKLTNASSTQILNVKQGNMNLNNSANNNNTINNTLINIGTNISSTSVTNTSTTSITKTKASSVGSSGSTKAATAITTTPTTTTDLFDLVKNSNGAISITPAPITTALQVVAPTAPAPFNLTSNFAQSNNFKSIGSFPSLTPNKPLESLSKIKIEPLDEQVNPVVIKAKEAVKTENPTSFSGQIPCNLKIKEEQDLMSPNNQLEEKERENSLSPQPNNILNNECSSSSSSFSSNSTSVSSAADLSLEASTPASIASLEANSPQCSILSPLNNTSPASVTSHPCSNSNSLSDSNSLNSCAMGASSRDMLSEMVTSACISSDSSDASVSVSLPENEESKLSSSEDKSPSPIQEMDKQPRDVPTPESGIGGSLSNIETMDTSSKSSSAEISSSASSSDSTASEIINSPEPPQSDTQTPPATPMNIEESQNETSSAASYLSQSQQSQDLTNSKSASSSSSSSTSSSVKSFDLLSTTIDTKLAEAFTKDAPKSAISPILSQPKTIRFPANGGKGNKKHDGICYWNKCNKKHESNSKLSDHMQHQHVNTQTGPFSCLWVGCKVYQKESCSRRWLERHVLSHGGSKQFKCIVEGCGLRFGSQLALQKHVNNHFTSTESKESTSKRTSDPPVPKQLRKNGKKLRYRRQPFSARMFDFFDAGIMEGLQHRLRQISTLTNGYNSITFKGQCIMKRRNYAGNMECFVQWSPREIVSDEWLPDSTEPFLKTVNIKQMKPAEKNKVESLLMAAYKMPYSTTIFENNYPLSQQYQRLQTTELSKKQTLDDNCNKPTEGDNNNDQHNAQQQEDEEDIDDDDDDEEDEEDATTTAETISSYQNVLTVNNIQIQQHKKHSRKSQNRIITTR